MSKTSREQEFEQHFTEIYGPRWPELKAALLAPINKISLTNPFGRDYQDYSLDEASTYPARFLGAQPGDKLGDFCASPGGKLLTSVFALKGEGEWHASDLSPARISRLKAVLYDCLPAEIRSRVFVHKTDASRIGLKFPEFFDRVLVDAPCSGERHLLATPKELERWSLKGVKRLAIRQHALLCSAIDSVKAGGRVVYSTCSVHPLENEGVIEKLMKSRKDRFRVVRVEAEKGEATEHGWILLPDRTGSGPIYFSVLEKVP